MRFSKRAVFFLLAGVIAIIIIVFILGVSIQFPFRQPQGFSCSSTCGLLSSDPNNSSHFLDGTVLDKHQSNGVYYFDFLTKDAKKHPVVLTFSLRSGRWQTIVTEYITKRTPKVKMYSGEQMYSILAPKQNWTLIILTPSQREIDDSRQKINDKHYLNCFDYHKVVIKYLKDPSFLTKTGLLVEKMRNNCSISLLSASRKL